MEEMILVGTREIAIKLSIRERDITKLVRQGMPYMQNGKGKMRFNPELVKAWVNSKMQNMEK